MVSACHRRLPPRRPTEIMLHSQYTFMPGACAYADVARAALRVVCFKAARSFHHAQPVVRAEPVCFLRRMSRE